jgi:hypothetical protein
MNLMNGQKEFPSPLHEDLCAAIRKWVEKHQPLDQTDGAVFSVLEPVG